MKMEETDHIPGVEVGDKYLEISELYGMMTAIAQYVKENKGLGLPSCKWTVLI